jgi:hypothetical protein
MKDSPPSSLITYLTTSRLPEKSVILRIETEATERHTSSTDVSPVLIDLLSRCASSQLAEGRCLTVASGASSLETIAVEEYKPIPLSTISDVSAPHLYLTVLGTVTVGLVALVSIIALVLGRDISLKATTASTVRSVEFTANHPKEATK